MSSIRAAVASVPLTASLADAVPAAIAAVQSAGQAGADVVVLGEAVLPGHRMQAAVVPDYDAAELEEAVDEVAVAARGVGIAVVLGIERPTPVGRQIAAVVLQPDGALQGIQPKRQIDPDEERWYVPGSGRRLFSAAGVPFAVATCHEAFRYPETVRGPVRDGARFVCVPHYVALDGARLPTRWCDPDGSYHEKALMCRALENTVYVAAANIATPHQASASCVIAPDGSLVTQVPYGEVGIAVADLDLDLASGLLAHRLAPERHRS